MSLSLVCGYSNDIEYLLNTCTSGMYPELDPFANDRDESGYHWSLVWVVVWDRVHMFSIYVSTDLKTNTKRIFIVSLNGTLTLERLAAK